MPRSSIDHLNGCCVDVLVIGAGANGASAAQHLSAAGYTVLVVDKGDFASGSSSRSSRILGNGMHYLAGGHSPWDFVLRPHRFASGCRMARFALTSRAQMVQTVPDRLHRVEFCFPIYRDGVYKPWQFDAGMMMLRALGTQGVDLNYRRITGSEALQRPLLQWLRDPEALSSVALFDQYQFRWPERVVLDTLLNAEETGAIVRNYTAVIKMDRVGDSWRVALRDEIDGSNVTVEAKVVLNMAGIWIDDVNASGPTQPSRKITGTKGIHIAVQLPPECKEASVTWQNRQNEHMYVLPWNGHHYIGPTETVYEGDLDKIHPTEDEIRWVIDEVNYMLPGMGLCREDVLYSWAGVRPWTSGPDAPKGLRVRVLHDLSSEGMPGVFALTGGPLMSHRAAGMDVCRTVQKLLPPSGAPASISYSSRPSPSVSVSASVTNSPPAVSVEALRYAAQHEHPVTLIDLLFRRVPIGWSESMGVSAARGAAEAVADIMDWDEKRISAEVKRYRDYIRRHHLVEVADQ